MLNPDTLAAKLSAQPFPPLKQALHWSAASSRFHFVLLVTSDRTHAMQMNTRDAFDRDGYDFDSVIAVAPPAHQAHKADDPPLHAVTYQIYPAFRCEVAGHETVKEVVARQTMIDPANIQREAKPYIRLRYLNTRTRGRSLGDKRGIDTSGVLLGELRKLANSPASFVEFENYRGEVARAEWDETRGYVLEWKNERRLTTEQDLLAWARNFICAVDR